MNIRKKITCVGILLASSLLCQGQVPYFRHISLLRKNEPVQVNCLFQDHTGFLWYGTNKGLFRFDGSNLVRYSLADSLPSENVTALAEDSLGRIWAGFKNGSISYLEDKHFRKFSPPEGNSQHPISDMHFDRKGNFWFSTQNDGLYYYINHRLYRLDKEDGLPDLYIYDIEEDKIGTIWAGTDGGAIACTLQGTKAEVAVHDYRQGLPDNIVKRIIVDNNGELWMGTQDAGVIHYDPIHHTFASAIPQWHFGDITDFAVDKNEIWISSQQTGLMVYHRHTNEIKFYNSLSGNGFTSINVLKKDSEGNIWAGTKTDIILTRGDQIEFIDPINASEGLNTIAIAAAADKAIWFSNGGVLYKRTINKTGRPVLEQPLKGTSFQKFTVISLYIDPWGYVWAGLYGEGVLRIHPETRRIRYINHELRNGNILNITGEGDLVWLATLGGGTQIKISGENLILKNFTSDDGLTNDYIYQIFIDSKRRIWFATDGKGVDMLDEIGFHHYEEGLNSKVVYGFAEDRNHRIWANVQGDGLYFLEGKAFQIFDPHGTWLRDNTISCFTSTPSGNLLIAHNSGIDIYDVGKQKTYFLGEEVGIRDKNPNLNAIAKDPFGAIFVGTNSGIIKYSDAGPIVRMPQASIQGLTVMNTEFAVSQDLNFLYNQNDVTIRYVGLWYQNPSALTYQYQLQNFDREWINSQNTSVTYSRLVPGTYVFKLRVSDGHDFNAENETSVTFTIQPPFWQTVWFYALLILAIIFLVFIVIQYRERKLKEDKQFLEAKVEERTLEIVKKNEEIHTQAEEIKAINENLEHLVKLRTHELEKKNQALEDYAFINAHELRAPVASILGLINLMQIVKKEEDTELYLKHLKTSADRLDKVVTTIARTIEKGDISSEETDYSKKT